MDTTNHQKLASFSQSLAIFAVLVVVPILGDLSDLTDHDLTLIKQMENFEKNLNADPHFFGAKILPNQIISNPEMFAAQTNRVERRPRILRDFNDVPETFDNLVDETQGVGVSSNASTSTISATPSVALSWLNQIKSPWNLTGLVKKLEARSNKTPVKLVLKVDSPGGQSPISLKIVKDSSKLEDGQRQEKHTLEFKNKEMSEIKSQSPGDPEKHLRPSNLVKKLVASENSWEPSYGEFFDGEEGRDFFGEDFSGGDNGVFDHSFFGDMNRRQDEFDDFDREFGPDSAYESSPLVGRIRDRSEEEDPSYLKFPNFAVAPTSYIERKQSSQEQVEKPEKLRLEQRPRKFANNPISGPEKKGKTEKSTLPTSKTERNSPKDVRSKEAKQIRQRPSDQKREPVAFEQLPEFKESGLEPRDQFPPWDYTNFGNANDFFKSDPVELSDNSLSNERNPDKDVGIRVRPKISEKSDVEDLNPEHRGYDSYHPHTPYIIGRNHIKTYRGKSVPVKGHHHDDHYGGEHYFAPWGYHASLTPDSHRHGHGGYHK